jgi:hypothetical protein
MVAQGSGSQMSLVRVEALAAVETQVSPAGHCVERQRFDSQVTVVGLQNFPGGQYSPPHGSGRQLPLTQRWPVRHVVESQRVTQAPFEQY